MPKRIVAVVVAVLVAAGLGTAGALVARSSGDREPAALPALRVEDGQSTARDAEGAPGAPRAAPSTAQDLANPKGTVAWDDPAAPFRYEVRGKLPELPRRARAWVLDDRAGDAQVRDLAGKLGLAGAPRRDRLGWTLVQGDRLLHVSALPGLAWTFRQQAALCGGGPYRAPGIPCATTLAPGRAPTDPPEVDPGLPGREANPPERAPAPPLVKRGTPPVRIRPPKPVALPDRAEAEAAARRVLSRVGMPLDGAELRLTRLFDHWLASASPRVGGLPTSGFTWTVGVGAHGAIISATGWLATPDAADTYPLITVQEALQRLRDRPLHGPILRPQVLEPLPGIVSPCKPAESADPPGGGRGAGAPGAPGGAGSAAAPGFPGCGARPRPVTLTVTDVRLGLQLATVLPRPDQKGGRRVEYLVPAYLFQIDGSWERQVAVVAVQDRFLPAPPPVTVGPLRSAPGG